MRAWPGWIWYVYERGVDYMNLDMQWFADIADVLQFDWKTDLNLLCLPKDLQNKIQETKPQNWISVNGERFAISLAKVFEELGIKSHEIIVDYKKRSIKSLKRQWVIYIWSINDYGDFNIQSIDGHFNSQISWTLSRNSFKWRYNLTYVLFYNKEKPVKISKRLLQFFKRRQSEVLQLESK